MARRGERVARPGRKGGWQLRFADNAPGDGWEELCRNAPSETRVAYDAIESDPFSRLNPRRQFRLKGTADSVEVKGTRLEQWQYEVTGAARVLYAPDSATHVVWIVLARVRHPKDTE